MIESCVNSKFYLYCFKNVLQEIDMIVTGMTITSHRDDVVDFTFPFWTEYSAVIMRHKGTDPFRFISLMKSFARPY